VIHGVRHVCSRVAIRHWKHIDFIEMILHSVNQFGTGKNGISQSFAIQITDFVQVDVFKFIHKYFMLSSLIVGQLGSLVMG
jgi:hypothetical protein